MIAPPNHRRRSWLLHEDDAKPRLPKKVIKHAAPTISKVSANATRNKCVKSIDVSSGFSLRSSSQSTSYTVADDADFRVEASGLRMLDAIEDLRIFKKESSVARIMQLYENVTRIIPENQAKYSNLKLKWPEFLEPIYRKTPRKLSILVRFTDRALIDVQLQHVKFVCSTADTMKVLLAKAFTKLHRLMGVQINDVDSYILKATGYKDFILRLDTELRQYQYINSCRRSGKTVDLCVIKLSQEEKDDRDELIKFDNKQHGTMVNYSIETPSLQLQPMRTQKVEWPFRLKVLGIENLPQKVQYDSVMITFALRIGNRYVSIDSETPFDLNIESRSEMFLDTFPVPFSSAPRWPPIWLSSSVYNIARLPVSTCLECTVFGVDTFSKSREVISAVKIRLFDKHARLREGKMSYRMWKNAVIQQSYDMPDYDGKYTSTIPSGFPIGENYEIDGGILHICFEKFQHPVVHHTLKETDIAILPKDERADSEIVSDVDQRRLILIAKYDSLHALSSGDKVLLWKKRYYCRNIAKLLPKFLLAVNWISPEAVAEAHRLLQQWQRPQLRDLIELVSGNYSDPKTREWATNLIGQMRDAELSEYLLQLVQALKHEMDCSSPLACMLIVRSLQNPGILGHKFFWLIRNETHRKEYCESFSNILAVYCMNCADHWYSLKNQLILVEKLENIAQQLRNTSRESQKSVAATELHALNGTLNGSFEMCLSPRFEATGIVLNQTRIMDSKKQPLWLAFNNADPLGKPIFAMFKCGDDLRQDLMTLQMLQLMDRIWQSDNLDLRLKPYLCQATSQMGGMIEVIENAKTTAQIHLDYGGSCFGPLMETPIDSFLRETSQGNNRVYERSVDNFVRSCAGYCVATYVMGIGDRHSDNIMVSNTGQLFHIDFGHFLGNFKYRFGMSRERAPFVFTPEMAFVMGSRHGSRFRTFEEMCCKSYNILRHHGHLFISLFEMMVPAGVPELTTSTDILYLRNQLSMELTEANATKKFKHEIRNALASHSRRIDNWMHSIGHGALLDRPSRTKQTSSA